MCKSSLEAYASPQGDDKLWSLISEAIALEETTSPSDASPGEHPLITRLIDCLRLTTAFRELLQQLKDSLLQQPYIGFNFSNHSTPGTVHSHPSSLGKKGSIMSTNASGSLTKRSSVQGKQKQGGTAVTSGGLTDSSTVLPVASGIALQNVDKITLGLTEFGVRVNKVLDIVSTLAQFRKLEGSLGGLPRVDGLWGGGEVEPDKNDGPTALPENAKGTADEGGSYGGETEDLSGGHLRLSTLREESVVSTGSGSSRGSEAGQEVGQEVGHGAGGTEEEGTKESVFSEVSRCDGYLWF